MQDLPSSSRADTALAGSSPGLAEEGATAGPSAGTTSAASPITDQGAGASYILDPVATQMTRH